MDTPQSADKVLTQEELNALLSMVGTDSNGDAEPVAPAPRRVVAYDFTRPEKFAREHLRLIKTTHDNHARSISNDLSLLLRMPVEVNTESVEQATFEQFLAECRETDLLAVEKLAAGGFILVSMGTRIAFAIADRLLGGAGAAGVEKQELTDIDRVIVTRIFQQLMASYAAAWPDTEGKEMELSLLRLHIGVEGPHALAPTENVAVVVQKVRLPSVQGEIKTCVPFATLKPALQEASQKTWLEPVQRVHPPEVAQDAEGNVKEAFVTLRALLGNTTLTVNELKALRVNDVLLLDQSAAEPLIVRLEDRPLLKGIPGLRHRNLAVRICDVLSSS